MHLEESTPISKKKLSQALSNGNISVAREDESIVFIFWHDVYGDQKLYVHDEPSSDTALSAYSDRALVELLYNSLEDFRTAPKESDLFEEWLSYKQNIEG